MLVMNLNILHIIWLIVLAVFHLIACTTITQLEHLFGLHEKVKDDLALYIEKEEKKLSFVKRNLAIFKTEHEKAIQDIPGYIGNPINAFTLIKRLTSDLKYLRESIKIQKGNLKREDVQYPSLEDLTIAVQNLAKLQETYELDVKELAEGKLKNVAYSTPMTASDCYELGRLLYKESNNENAKYARAWLVEAYRKYNEDEMFFSFTQVDIIEHISMACFKMGDIESALHWAQVLLDVDPQHSQAKEIIAYFKRIISTETKLIETGGQVNSEEEYKKSTLLQTTYKALCRGDMSIPVEVSSRLKCYYQNRNHPFLKIAPFKVEVMYQNPDVIFFHDVLNDDEIETLKQMANLKFTRSSDHESGNHQPNSSACFRDAESNIIARISRRVNHMTGLCIDADKGLNVANLMIGDNCILHYDFDSRIIEDCSGVTCGNKIGTLLLYMSHVTLGGATVFPVLGLSIHPVKGGVAFWLNLHASGEGDIATLHSNCPVLQGSKWEATTWIGQCIHEFSEVCTCDRQCTVNEHPRSTYITTREIHFFEEYNFFMKSYESDLINKNYDIINNVDEMMPNPRMQ